MAELRSAGPGADDEAADLREAWVARRDAVLGRLALLEDALDGALDAGLHGPMRAMAGREAHKLAGSLGTFGFVPAARMAREVEHALRSERPLDAADLAHLRGVVARMRGELEAA